MKNKAKKFLYNNEITIDNNRFNIYEEQHNNLDFALDKSTDFIFNTTIENTEGIYLFITKDVFCFIPCIFDFLCKNVSKINKKSNVKSNRIILFDKEQLFYVGSDNEVLSRAKQHITDKNNTNNGLKLSVCTRKWIKKHLKLLIIPYTKCNIKRTAIETAIRKEYTPLYSNK